MDAITVEQQPQQQEQYRARGQEACLQDFIACIATLPSPANTSVSTSVFYALVDDTHKKLASLSSAAADEFYTKVIERRTNNKKASSIDVRDVISCLHATIIGDRHSIPRDRPHMVLPPRALYEQQQKGRPCETTTRSPEENKESLHVSLLVVEELCSKYREFLNTVVPIHSVAKDRILALSENASDLMKANHVRTAFRTQIVEKIREDEFLDSAKSIEDIMSGVEAFANRLRCALRRRYSLI